MKAILLAFCALAITSALAGGDMHEKIHAAAEKCIAETGADGENVKKLTHHEPFEADDKTKCFSACMMKFFGMMAEDGTVDVAGAKAKVPSDMPHREKILEAMDACGSIKGANECDTGYLIGMCMNKHRKMDMD